MNSRTAQWTGRVLSGIAVLFVTANPKIALETLRGNAPRVVMAKPFDIDVLAEAVRELLREEVAA